MGTLERICRLCLEKSDRFKAIGGNEKELINLLLPRIILIKCEDSVMCTNCANVLQKCFQFKTMCRLMQDSIIMALDNKDNAERDLKDSNVYQRENDNVIDIADMDTVCGFCLSQLETNFSMSVETFKDDIKLKTCLPELDVTIIKKAALCGVCYESLEDYFSFITNCDTVEEKIRKYCQAESSTSNGSIELEKVVEFTSKSVSTNIEKIKVEEIYLTDSYHSNEDQNHEDKNFIDIDKKYMLTSGENEDDYKIENWKMENHKHELANEEIEIKADSNNFNSFPDDVVLPPSEASNSSRQKKHGSRLKSSMYKCEYCSYKAQCKSRLKRHILIHKDPSGVMMYQCDSCPYQTKHKSEFPAHCLTHKTPSDVTFSEVRIYKCAICSYQAPHKRHLSLHSLVHKNSSRRPVYTCESCFYQARYKSALTQHSLIHKDPSEITMYQCHTCSYQTKYKHYLEKHHLIHKDASELTLFQCESCTFQTKHKNNLKTHRVIHRDPSELTMFECESCSFRTSHKYSIVRHSLVHKNPSELTMFQCESCSYQTKHKKNLKSHRVMHKDPSELTMFQCESCSFQTKYRSSFATHCSRHKDTSGSQTSE